MLGPAPVEHHRHAQRGRAEDQPGERGVLQPADGGQDADRVVAVRLVEGEGAAVLVLEERETALARGAEVLMEVAGFGMTADAGDIVAPSAEGAIGTSTIGSSEACMLGGLALKRRWQLARRAAGTSTEKPMSWPSARISRTK